VTQATVATSSTTINGQTYNFAGAAPVGTVSVGNAGAERTITNVAAGRISATSTDAINGSQLYATNQSIEDLSDQIGDIGDVAENAVTYQTVTNPDGSVTRTNNVVLQGGDPSAPVVISNVGAGVADTDAVNVAQLNDQVDYAIDTANNYTDQVAVTTLNQAKDYTDQKFDELNQAIDGVQDEARQAAAIGLAAASLRYDDRPGKFSVSVGGGYWQSEGAFAFGGGYTSESGRIRANLSGVTAGGDWGVGAGLSFTLN
jgi:autotransporter adhesin